MTVDDRQRAFEELRSLLLRSEGTERSLLPSLGRSRELLTVIAPAPWSDHDRWLLEALGNPAQPPGPLAAGLLALRMAALAGLGLEASLDVALSGVLLRCEARRLAEERIRQSAGKDLRAHVLLLVQCRGERLDGSGSLGLQAEKLDVASLLNAAACAYVERLSKGSSPLQALAAVAGAPELFGEGAHRLAQALSSFPLGSYVRPRLRDDGSIRDPEAERMLRLLEDEAGAPPAGKQPDDWLAGAGSDATPVLEPAAEEDRRSDDITVRRNAELGAQTEQAACDKIQALRQAEAPSLEAATRRTSELQERLRHEQRLLLEETRLRGEAELGAQAAQAACDKIQALCQFEAQSLEAATRRTAELQESLRLEQSLMLEETRLRGEAELGAQTAQAACDKIQALCQFEAQNLEAATRRTAELQERLRHEQRLLLEETRLRGEAELGAQTAQAAYERIRAQREQAVMDRQQAQSEEIAARELQRRTELADLIDAFQDELERRLSDMREATKLEEVARAGDAEALAREAAGFADWSASETSAHKETLDADAHANAVEVRELEGKFAAILLRLGAEPAEIERLRIEGRLHRVEALWAERLREQGALIESQKLARRELAQRRKVHQDLQEALRRRLRLRLEATRAEHRTRVEELWEKIAETTREVERETAELARLREEVSLDPSAASGDVLADDRSALAAVRGVYAESADDLLSRLTAVEADIARSEKTLDGFVEAERIEQREADDVMRRLRQEVAGEMRSLRAGSGLSKLRAQLAAEQQHLNSLRGVEAQALAAAQDEKARHTAELEQARAQLQQDQQHGRLEKSDLEKIFLEKRGRLEQLRGAALETSQRRRALEEGLARAAAAFQQEAADRLTYVRESLAARKEALVRLLAGLTEDTGQARREHDEVMSAFQERRRGVEDEIRRLRSEWGDLQGLLASCKTEQASLRQALSAALSEVDLQLLEATFSLDTARKEAAALSQEHDGRLADWERAGRELEALSDEFARLSGTAAPLFEQWRELAGGGLAGVSAVLREQLLARARELGIWSGRLSGIDRRLAASRAALEAGLFETCREAGQRAFREGRLDEARASLRQALSFKKDSEVRALLDRLEAPRQTSTGEQDGSQ